ncbi:hypothetical protein Mapa_009065 [Marchantia paleacea]|nr:hypothetical protein Mapa_009065 [Marchantia paleacea]
MLFRLPRRSDVAGRCGVVSAVGAQLQQRTKFFDHQLREHPAMAQACCQALSLQVGISRPVLSHEGQVTSSESSSRDAIASRLLRSQFRGNGLHLRTSSADVRSSAPGSCSVTTRVSYISPGWSSPSGAGGAKSSGVKNYERIGECLVYAAFPNNKKPKGIIQFLGGAFIGASPDITYRYFIELLRKENYIVVAVPYNVTFDHTQAARQIHKKFNTTLNFLRRDGVPFNRLPPAEVSTLPIFSVGHSNGALMQVLMGSLCYEGQLPKANAVIAFNNKPASDAVPFFEQMGPAFQQASPMFNSSPFTTLGATFAARALEVARNSSIPLPPGVGQDDLQSVQNFIEQIPGVFNEVTGGVSEFTPTPAENRRTISTKYQIPNNLLIKFTDDTIDETDRVEESIRNRSMSCGGVFKKLVLKGTHATPLAQDIRWEVGVYSPVDAVAQVVKDRSLVDLRSLVRSVVDFFDSLS